MLNAAQPELFVLLKLSTITCVFSLWWLSGFNGAKAHIKGVKIC